MINYRKSIFILDTVRTRIYMPHMTVQKENERNRTLVVWFLLFSYFLWYTELELFIEQEVAIMFIDDLFITNYREFAGMPLQSITRLPESEAFELARKLSAQSRSSRDRYGNYFPTYYRKRLRTEKWLYRSFIEAGGDPQTEHPIYFVLDQSESLCSFFGVNETKKILLKKIDSKFVSFTPRDSMHLMDMQRTDGTVWRKETLEKMLQESKRNIFDFIKNIPEQYGQHNGYIEVQLWNDECFLSDVE